MHNNKSQETIETKIFLGDNKMVAVKPKYNKMISDSCSLSYPISFSLTHALQLSVSDFVW